MTRAEEAALKAYPEDIQLFVESQEEPGKWLPVDENIQFRYGYKQGYEQAEKDLTLTIKDLELLHVFLYAVKNNKQGVFTFTRLSDEQYQEVLKRFKEAEQ